MSPVSRLPSTYVTSRHFQPLNTDETSRLTWEVFLSGFCKTLPRREEIMMVAEVDADADADIIRVAAQYLLKLARYVREI